MFLRPKFIWARNVIKISLTSDDIKIYNNIVVTDQSLAGGRALKVSDNSTNILIGNNIIVGTLDANSDAIDTNTIFEDPLYADSTNFDFSITSDSPAIAVANVQFSPDEDFYGNPRDAAPDIGAVEFRTVDVVDTTVPVITLVGAATVSLEVGTTYTDAGATATDNYDGDISSAISTVNPEDSDTVGTYTVTYDVSDANGNAATTVTRTVDVVDTTVPVITLVGAATVSLEVGTTYTDAGATATDNYDGDISSAISTVNPVDSDTVGTYTVTYDVSDANGNAATTVTRTVIIESSLSIEDNTMIHVKLYPNPVEDKLFIQGFLQPTEIFVYNLLGKLVLSEIALHEINVSNLQSGVYIIKMKKAQKQLVRKFIKN